MPKIIYNNTNSPHALSLARSSSTTGEFENTRHTESKISIYFYKRNHKKLSHNDVAAKTETFVCCLLAAPNKQTNKKGRWSKHEEETFAVISLKDIEQIYFIAAITAKQIEIYINFIPICERARTKRTRNGEN
jgi:hypothetical protein